MKFRAAATLRAALIAAALALFSAPAISQPAAEPGKDHPMAGQSDAGDETKKWPSSLDEAVSKLVAGLSDKDVKTLCQTKENDLIRYHFSWGMGIRNSFGLWGGNRDLLRSACGNESCHPDDASMIIIEHVWKSLQEKKCRQ